MSSVVRIGPTETHMPTKSPIRFLLEILPTPKAERIKESFPDEVSRVLRFPAFIAGEEAVPGFLSTVAWKPQGEPSPHMRFMDMHGGPNVQAPLTRVLGLPPEHARLPSLSAVALKAQGDTEDLRSGSAERPE